MGTFKLPSPYADNYVMVILFTLLITLGFAGKHSQSDSGGDISAIAAHYLEKKPKLTMEACNGLVLDILSNAGITMKGRVDSLWAQSRSNGWTHHRKTPRPGDLVFWHRTYDRNRNGKIDDSFTHIGVVISVDAQQTALIVHRGSKGIRPLRMNLHHPDTYKQGDTVFNDFLAASGYGRKDERLSGQLFAGFATLGAKVKTVAVKAEESPKPKTKQPISKTISVNSPPSIAQWQAIPPQVRRRVQLGRGVLPGRLRSLDCGQLWALRNTIFARHGFNFQTARAQQLFSTMTWYAPDTKVTQDTAAGYLTSLDYENIEMIMRLEHRRCDR